MKKDLTIIKVGQYRVHITLQDVVVFKTVLTVGILAVHFLPNETAIPITVATNLLWLWRG